MANGKGDDRAHCEQKAVVIPEAAECADRETKPEGDPEAAERRHNLAQGESPGISGHPLPSLFPFDLQPSTFDLLKNEATDLLDNKRSASSEIRNEATVESSRRSAGSSRSARRSRRSTPCVGCGLPTAFLHLRDFARNALLSRAFDGP